MCIIVVKPAGVSFPTEQVFKNCMSTNKDGFGAMWRGEDGRVQIDKGYMADADVLKWRAAHAERLKDVDVVMHFRFATHGEKDEGSTHPFPITNVVADLKLRRCSCTRALAHNGVLSEFGKSTALSDTMVFVKHLSNMSVASFVGSAIARQYGKFVYMNGSDTIMFGVFFQDAGCYYSNEGFRVGRFAYNKKSYAPATTAVSDDEAPSTMIGCDGDCFVCMNKVSGCVWNTCDHNCTICSRKECVYEIDVVSRDDWSKNIEKAKAQLAAPTSPTPTLPSVPPPPTDPMDEGLTKETAESMKKLWEEAGQTDDRGNVTVGVDDVDKQEEVEAEVKAAMQGVP